MNKLLKLLIATAALLGLVLGMTACGANDDSVSWSGYNLSNDGAVENLDCKLFDTGKGYDEQPARGPIWQVRTAIADNDGDALKTLFGADKPSDDVKQKVRTRLEERLKSCKPGAENTADVTSADGKLQKLPVVQGGDIVRGDSTGAPETPSVVPVDAIKACGTLATWQSLVDCMGDQQWYIDGVNQSKPYTGFDWNDVKRWAVDSKNIDVRVIPVYNMDISDDEARSAVRTVVGDAADGLPVVRHGDFINTRGLEEGKMSPFLDRKRQVRVSLAPLVYIDGKPARLRADAGVFVDCLNPWGIPKAIGAVPPNPAPHVPPPPSNPPGTVPPTTVPPTNPPTNPPTTTPPPTLTPKVPTQAPPHDGGTGTVTAPPSPPAGGQPVPTYTTQAPPPPIVVPPNQGGPTPNPTTRVTPAPETGAPVPSAPETECIPAPGAPC